MDVIQAIYFYLKLNSVLHSVILSGRPKVHECHFGIPSVSDKYPQKLQTSKADKYPCWSPKSKVSDLASLWPWKPQLSRELPSKHMVKIPRKLPLKYEESATARYHVKQCEILYNNSQYIHVYTLSLWWMFVSTSLHFIAKYSDNPSFCLGKHNAANSQCCSSWLGKTT